MLFPHIESCILYRKVHKNSVDSPKLHMLFLLENGTEELLIETRLATFIVVSGCKLLVPRYESNYHQHNSCRQLPIGLDSLARR
jgi:hypothetical protein